MTGAISEPLATYLELRESTPEGDEAAGLSHKAGGQVLLHVLELAAYGEPRGGVTIVHDAGDHGGRYLGAARALAEERLAVALPDLRGHGRSEGERGHSAGLNEVLRDLDAVQEHLAYRLPIAPKALVGIGLGALYALAYAIERPGQLAALALLAPRWKPSFEMPRAGGVLARFKKPAPNQPGRIGIDPAQLTADPAEQRRWREDPLVHDAITLRAASQAAEIAERYGRRLGELDLPVLLMHGSRDVVSDPAESRKRAAGRVELEIREEGLHDLLHGPDGREVAEELRAWLAGAV